MLKTIAISKIIAIYEKVAKNYYNVEISKLLLSFKKNKYTVQI